MECLLLTQSLEKLIRTHVNRSSSSLFAVYLKTNGALEAKTLATLNFVEQGFVIEAESRKFVTKDVRLAARLFQDQVLRSFDGIPIESVSDDGSSIGNSTSITIIATIATCSIGNLNFRWQDGIKNHLLASLVKKLGNHLEEFLPLYWLECDFEEEGLLSS